MAAPQEVVMLELSVGPAPAGATDAFVASGTVSTPAPAAVFEPVGEWYRRLVKGLAEVSNEADEADSDGEGAAEEVSEELLALIECPDQKKFDCDPSNWRSQDHYALLGLKNLGYEPYKAPMALINAAFKKQTMWNHPDKKSRGDWTDADREAADGFFTCIKKAHEQLSNATDRRLFDSVNVPDGYDDVPDVTKDEAKFWKVYPDAFRRNARWLTKTPPPVGDDSTPEDEVNALYEFWYQAETWREFGYDEDQAADNDSREQKRYVAQKNKAARKKKQKEERARLLKFIDNAYASDPRIRRAKIAKKEAKIAKEQAAKEAAEAAKREAELAAAREAERQAAEEAASKEMNKNAKEMAKRAKRGFVKALKRFELCENDDGSVPEGGISNDVAKTMQDKLSTERLREMMEIKDKDEFAGQLAEEVEALKTGIARKAPATTEWSQEEQSSLEKALKTVPKDAEDRWGEVAKLIPGRTKGEVLIRVKTLMAEIEAKKKMAPVEWTEEEKIVLQKAASKVYPPGTQPDPTHGDRWGQIANYLQVHAHTTWTRGSKDIIAQVNAMKDVSSGLAEKKSQESSAFSSFEREKSKQKDKSDLPRPGGKKKK